MMGNVIRRITRQIRLFNAAKELDPYADWENVPTKELAPIGTVLNERQMEAVQQAKLNEKKGIL